jgi:hypothetical protein
MKSLFSSALLLLTFSLNAQAPTAVPVKDEPHHHLVLENSYVRVFRVSIPANDATLLHQHDLPYVFVSLGPADFTNAVAGKPEVEAKLADGQLGYSRGGFAHIARTDHGLPFNNVTIELLHPQGEPHNLCEKVIDGPLGACSEPAPSEPPANSAARVTPFKARPLFETSEVRAVSNTLEARSRYTHSNGKFAMLFVVANDSELQIEFPGEPARSPHSGEVLWLDAGGTATISCPLKQGASRYWVFFFKDAKPAQKK